MSFCRLSVMNAADIINKTDSYVKASIKSSPGDSAHDWWHIDRVRRLALKISEKEGGDKAVIELASLLHDIADWKFHGGDESVGPKVAKEWLESQKVPKEKIDHICQLIKDLTFKGAGVKSQMKTIEGMIVQDADRLDAMGAIGIARAFIVGISRGRGIYDPSIKPRISNTFKSYKKNDSTTINHFYEKLLLLKDRMNTKTAKKLAEGRHKFMELFLERFFAEWEAKQ
jgi:uncharacterized protein